MRLTQKKIEEVMLSILGEEGLPLVKELQGKDNISEFDLAHKTKKDIKIVRKMLYLLYNHNLISFTRKKDKEKGWYIYYWTLLPDSIKFSYFKKKRELLDRLKQRLGEENLELFFVCSNNCIRLNFDQAMDFEFHCPECGELISQDENKDRLEVLRKKINEIEEELEQLKEQRKVRRKTVKARKKKIRIKKKQKNKAGKKKLSKKAKGNKAFKRRSIIKKANKRIDSKKIKARTAKNKQIKKSIKGKKK